MLQENNEDACPGCNQTIASGKIRHHLQTCPKTPITILKQVQRFDKGIPKNVIKFLRVQLQMCMEKLDELSNNKSNKDSEFQKFGDFMNKIPAKNAVTAKPPQPSVSSIRREQQIQVDLSVYKANIVVCKKCDKKYYQNFDRDILLYVYDCWHVFCLPCINKYIDCEFINQNGELKCLDPDCNTIFLKEQIQGLIGKEKYEILQNKAIRKMCNLIQCFKCKQQFQFSEGNPKDAPKKDNNGKQMKIQHAKDYSTNRFICPTPSCKTQQCRTCQANPYHLGMTCKQYKDRALLKKCRYCNEPLTEKNVVLGKVKALADICNAFECQESAKHACQKVLGCGHSCFGFKDQKSCLPCLNQKCAQSNKQLNGVNGDEYCAICYVEPLSASPCVRSTCGHIFHVKCLKKRFEIKWLTPRIFFNFCLCPLCKKWITVAQESELYNFSQDFKVLYQKIQTMSMDRLKFEQLQKSDEKLKDKSSPYFGKPKQYAMIIYAYFQCYKCKSPYFGGRKDCVAAMNQSQNAGGSFKAEQLICPNCCQIPVEDCPKHGKDFIQFKCKFCCSIAQWFCWGNTHFCEPCHKRQCNGDYVSKYTKDQLPKCQVGKCPVGGNHEGNGQQKMLGCAICRNFKQNQKGF